MEQHRFIELLSQEGFGEALTVTREANDGLDEHTHPFEAKALILAGELSITTAGGKRFYRQGDIFHLQTGEPHSERYGPQGVTYLVGRKS